MRRYLALVFLLLTACDKEKDPLTQFFNRVENTNKAHEEVANFSENPVKNTKANKPALFSIKIKSPFEVTQFKQPKPLNIKLEQGKTPNQKPQHKYEANRIKEEVNCREKNFQQGKIFFQNQTTTKLALKATITEQKRTWAILSAPNSQLVKVNIGDHIGKHNDKIIAINKDHLLYQRFDLLGNKCIKKNYTLLMNNNTMDSKHE